MALVPGSPQWQKRIVEVLARESEAPPYWWYLSFAGEEGFRGGVFVEARGFVGAIAKATAMGSNPHGEIASVKVEVPIESFVPPEYRNRLLTKAEIEFLDREAMSRHAN